MAIGNFRTRMEAEVAAGLLGEIVRVRTRSDFERALEALARIQLGFPEVPTAVKLMAVGAAPP